MPQSTVAVATSPRNQSVFAHVLARSSCPDLEVLKLGNHAERLYVSGHPFGKHRDPILVHVAEESPGLFYMKNESRMETHKPRTSCIGRHRIVRENNSTAPAQFSLQGAVPLHGLDSVGNHEVIRDGRTDIEDALVNSVPMETVLGPTVSHPGYDAEHVLQTERDTGP